MSQNQRRTHSSTSRLRWRSGLFVAVGLACGLSACTGGGGGLSDAIRVGEPTAQSQEGAPRSVESAGNSVEGADETNENTPYGSDLAPGVPVRRGASGGSSGSTPTSAESCAGTYICIEKGKSKTRSVSRSSSGACSYDGVLAELDGRLTKGGTVVGSWSGSPSTGIAINLTGEATITCTKLTSAK